jgi:hypothetical protein
LNQVLDYNVHGHYFYGTRGKWPSAIAQLAHNPKLMSKYNAAIATVLGGSDFIKGSTDQGMVTDPNGSYIMHHFHVLGRGNIFGDWGGGPGHAAAQRWREGFEAGKASHGDMFGGTVPPHFTTGDVAHALHVEVPHGHTSSVNINQPIMLDGKKIAENTSKHLVRHGNRALMGGRMARRDADRLAAAA